MRTVKFSKALLALAISLCAVLVTFCPGAESRAPFMAMGRGAGIGAFRHAHRVHRTQAPTQQHHRVIQYSGHDRQVVYIRHAHHRRHHHVVAAAPKVRHAYPVNFFLLKPPDFDASPYDFEMSQKIRHDFENGLAAKYPARALVKAGIVTYHPLHGGIFWRREPVKYIILHSTETGVPQAAPRVIDSWNSGGRRHAGAQFVVDRDGTIYLAVDPDLATVHVNVFKTLPGINNDDTIGIEMVHAGHQTYTDAQKLSMVHLLTYLQQKYSVTDGNVITHRYAQQGDHTDPVSFDLDGFLDRKNEFKNRAIARSLHQMTEEAQSWDQDMPVASTFLQIHGPLPIPTSMLPSKSGKANLAQPVKSATTAPPSGSAPTLRGPIELDPQAAVLLNAQDAAAKASNKDDKTPLANVQQKKPASADTSKPAVPDQEPDLIH